MSSRCYCGADRVSSGGIAVLTGCPAGVTAVLTGWPAGDIAVLTGCPAGVEGGTYRGAVQVLRQCHWPRAN